MKKHRLPLRTPSCLQKFVPPSQKTWESPAQTISKQFIKACQDRDRGKSFSTSKRNERWTAMARCGLPEEWWHNEAERYRCLRKCVRRDRRWQETPHEKTMLCDIGRTSVSHSEPTSDTKPISSPGPVTASSAW